MFLGGKDTLIPEHMHPSNTTPVRMARRRRARAQDRVLQPMSPDEYVWLVVFVLWCVGAVLLLAAHNVALKKNTKIVPCEVVAHGTREHAMCDLVNWKCVKGSELPTLQCVDFLRAHDESHEAYNKTEELSGQECSVGQVCCIVNKYCDDDSGPVMIPGVTYPAPAMMFSSFENASIDENATEADLPFEGEHACGCVKSGYHMAETKCKKSPIGTVTVSYSLDGANYKELILHVNKDDAMRRFESTKKCPHTHARTIQCVEEFHNAYPVGLNTTCAVQKEHPRHVAFDLAFQTWVLFPIAIFASLAGIGLAVGIVHAVRCCMRFEVWRRTSARANQPATRPTERSRLTVRPVRPHQYELVNTNGTMDDIEAGKR